MAFFGFGNYSKPGPGVSKDEIPKIAPVRFFEIVGRKFWKLIQVNLLFLIFFLLATFLSAVIWAIPGIFSISTPILSIPIGEHHLTLDLWNYLTMPIPFIFVFPFMAGLTIVTRNFAREEHAFILSDFMKSAKNNASLFIKNGILTYVLYVVLSFSISFYFLNGAGNSMFFIPAVFCFLLILMYVFTQFYLCVIFVTFDLSFKQAYKNAFILSIMGLGRNLLLLIIFVAMIVGAYFLLTLSPITFLFLVLFAIFLLFAFVSLLINFAIYPLIDQYLINPSKNPKSSDEKDSDSANTENSPIFQNLGEDIYFEEEDDEDGYVYVNGRMMKKSDVNKD